MAAQAHDRPAIDTVLHFWFARATAEKWFRTEDQAAFDAQCRDHVGALMDQARAGDLEDWQETPKGCLALTILLDQIPRNLERGTTGAFVSDAQARAVARRAIDAGFDMDMMLTGRLFLYMPFEHSEILSDQERSLALFQGLGCPFYLTFAVQHHVIIERFGRFPHRNTILERTSTAEELEFLKGPNSSF